MPKQVDALLVLEDALISQSLFVQKPHSKTISLKQTNKHMHTPSSLIDVHIFSHVHVYTYIQVYVSQKSP